MRDFKLQHVYGRGRCGGCACPINASEKVGWSGEEVLGRGGNVHGARLRSVGPVVDGSSELVVGERNVFGHIDLDGGIVRFGSN